MTDRETTITLLKNTSFLLRLNKLTSIFSNAYSTPTASRQALTGYFKRVLTVVLIIVSTASHAQSDYTSSNSGGAIAYYGNSVAEYAEGEFRIATHPVVSENNMPKGKYYSLVPKSYEMPLTNLEYYPGAENIAISFKFDTSLVNVNDMRYAVVTEDSSVVMNWSPLPKGRWVPQGGSGTILFLDDMACKNQVVLIKLYHVNNPESVITQIVNTKKLTPPPLFGSVVYILPKSSAQQKKRETISNLLGNFGVKALDNLTIHTEEELNALGISIHTDVPYFYRAYVIRTTGSTADTIDLPSNWVKTDERIVQQMKFMSSDIDWDSLPNPRYTINIPRSVITEDGKYQVFVTTADYQKGRSRSRKALPLVTSNILSFRVERSRAFSSSDVMLIIGSVLLLGGVYFLLLKQSQRRRLRKEQQTTKEARLSLQAVQSQLNPHFIFNALSGIQNLMNKQENEKANAYLTTFSKLTRMVLNDAHKELIPLSDETTLLDYYLRMEQLRFGFSYQIDVATSIDSQNTEIPPMLLQPFLENAVKHGIASLKEAGAIQINIRREQQDLFIEIRDNGKGFDASLSYTGKGLELSKSRLSLLNTVYGPIFNLDIRSRVSETLIIITIKNWLA